jgi:hypothetical protein
MIAADKAILIGRIRGRSPVETMHVFRNKDGIWSQQDLTQQEPDSSKADLAGHVEIRSVQRRQLFVDGKPVGTVFE